jgi:hypothetical protein
MFVYLNIAKKTLCHKPTHEKQAWTPLKNLYRLSKKTSPHYVLWYCNVSFDSSFRFLYFIPYKNPKLLLKLKPGAHWSYLLSWASLVTVGVSKLPQCAVAFWAISATRAIGTEYSTCCIISVTNEHFFQQCALEKLSPFIVDGLGMRNKTWDKRKIIVMRNIHMSLLKYYIPHYNYFPFVLCFITHAYSIYNERW